MNCSELNRLFMGQPVTPADRDHMLRCERCQLTLKSIGVEEVMPDLVRPKPASRGAGRSAAIGAVALSVLALGLWRLGAAGFAQLEGARMASFVAIPALFAVALAGSAGAQLAPGSRLIVHPHWIAGGAAAASAGLAVWLHPIGEWNAAYATGCFAKGLIHSLPAALVFVLVSRRAVIFRPSWLGATLGMLVGLVGFAMSTSYCPVADRLHAFASHVALLACFSAAGWLVGSMIERRRLSRVARSAIDSRSAE